MIEVKRSGQDRRSHSQADISALVSTRSETLARYAELASHRPFETDDQFDVELKQFCEALIDYTASAHFQLYRHWAENNERRQMVRKIADKVYPKIAQTTDQILAFNDRYGDDVDASHQFVQIEHDLSSLGEILADRIQYEDEVISAMTSERRVA